MWIKDCLLDIPYFIEIVLLCCKCSKSPSFKRVNFLNSFWSKSYIFKIAYVKLFSKVKSLQYDVCMMSAKTFLNICHYFFFLALFSQ